MPPGRRLILMVLGTALLAVAPVLTVAQEATPGGDAPQLHPGVRLGLRVLAARRQIPIVPVLVIVPDEGAYLDAVERWRLGSMHPVLIDDGSDLARENIARFVRAFEPDAVVRGAPREKAEEPVGATLPGRAESIVAGCWGAESSEALDERWRELKFVPPGVVVMSAEDPAWVAGVALAAGHGQPIVWTEMAPGDPAHQLKPAQIDALERDITHGLDTLDWAWDAIGDDVDAVTLCLNVPARLPEPPDGAKDLALTDRIGRHADGRRYAWCGMLFGDAPTSAYRAMCSLFLAPDTGWIFDAYDAGFPPEFNAGRILPLFERMDFEFVYTAANGGTLAAWRARCRGGIGGGFVQVNSSGHPTWFQLARKERAWASETPELREPAIVHFIHSFSARFANNPTTIAGRWLENGAYAYIGSVHEPYLQGFVPPEAFFARLFAGVPWGAAGRHDNAPAWKIQVLGDPLIIAGPARPRREVEVEFAGAVSLEDEMRAALKERRFAEGVGLLVTLGRDEDALRVTRAALKNEDAGEGADLATLSRAAIFPAFRAGDAALFVDLYERLPSEVAERHAQRAMLWQLLRPRLGAGEPDEGVVSLLRRNIRDGSAADDAMDLRGALAKLYGRSAVDSMFLSLIERVKNEGTKRKLREAMQASRVR